MNDGTKGCLGGVIGAFFGAIVGIFLLLYAFAYLTTSYRYAAPDFTRGEVVRVMPAALSPEITYLGRVVAVHEGTATAPPLIEVVYFNEKGERITRKFTDSEVERVP